MSRRVFSFCFVAALMSPTIAFSQSFLSQYNIKACLITTPAIVAVHKKYRERSCALTMTWAARESRIMTPIQRITVAES